MDRYPSYVNSPRERGDARITYAYANSSAKLSFKLIDDWKKLSIFSTCLSPDHPRRFFFLSKGKVKKKMNEFLLNSYLTEPEVTKNGIGVGHGLNGELLTELRVLLNTECGHCGGPTCPPEDALPLLEERPFRQGIFDQPLTFFPDNPANEYVCVVYYYVITPSTLTETRC